MVCVLFLQNLPKCQSKEAEQQEVPSLKSSKLVVTFLQKWSELLKVQISSLAPKVLRLINEMEQISFIVHFFLLLTRDTDVLGHLCGNKIDFCKNVKGWFNYRSGIHCCIFNLLFV